MHEIIETLICIVCGAFTGYGIARFLVDLKMKNVAKNHDLISTAIFLYTMDNLAQKKESEVKLGDMESVYRTNSRLFDWGYKKILPEDKFKIIEPYIEKVIEVKKREKRRRKHGACKMIDCKHNQFGRCWSQSDQWNPKKGIDCADYESDLPDHPMCRCSMAVPEEDKE